MIAQIVMAVMLPNVVMAARTVIAQIVMAVMLPNVVMAAKIVIVQIVVTVADIYIMLIILKEYPIITKI